MFIRCGIIYLFYITGVNVSLVLDESAGKSRRLGCWLHRMGGVSVIKLREGGDISPKRWWSVMALITGCLCSRNKCLGMGS